MWFDSTLLSMVGSIKWLFSYYFTFITIETNLKGSGLYLLPFLLLFSQ